jgi:CheY-like chemotaxis protein
MSDLNILLANDDIDDCIFFRQALTELSSLNHLTHLNDGEELMLWLSKHGNDLPDMLFLDLYMPRKNGFECLAEIKRDKKLGNIPVVMFSTSMDTDVVDRLYSGGAQYFIRKPTVYTKFRDVIDQALGLLSLGSTSQPARVDFVLTPPIALFS